MLDLFGKDYTETDLLPVRKTLLRSKLGRFKYRKSESHAVRCKTCDHMAFRDSSGKRYYKCDLVSYSHSSASDIRCNNVCDAWEHEV